MSKVKILLVGAVQEHFSVLQKKLESLQSSKAGPFDVCFCVGPIQVPSDLEKPMPLPVYLQELSSQQDAAEKQADDNGIVSLSNNLFTFQNPSADKNLTPVFEIPTATGGSLSVALCSRNARSSSNSKERQCDLLLSPDWPQGMEEVLQVDTEPLSFDVAEIALDLRPRYHVAPSTQYYHASPPYDLPQSDHVGRFLALAPVTATKPTKTTKFIHALGLVPLSANPPPTMAPSTLPCPFLSSNNNAIAQTSSVQNTPAFAMQAAGGPAYSRFATNKRSRDDNHHHDNDNHSNSLQPPDDPSIKTLFLYGLHKDVSGELQSTSSSKVLQAFTKFGVETVRHPPNSATSTYCFLEFPNQQQALQCLLDCQGHMNIDGVDLTLKWATTNKANQNNKRPKTAVHYVTHDEAPDSVTLYFHPNKGVEFSEEFATSLQLHLQKTLEEALNEGNDESERVTAETEPALAVAVRTKESFGFLEFASHAAATMALAAVTTSTDGGFIVETPENVNAPKPPESVVGATLRWAKGELKKSKRDEVLEALGLQRQYYPADSRTDCWFCLASPTCETHLIVGVYNEWYATLPKGAVHPGHVLLVPVEHTHQGGWTLSAAAECYTDLVNKVQQHASKHYDMDLFVFERAMATKGAYHTHVQCVPIPRNCASQLQSTMMAHGKASGFDLRPIQSDLGMASLLQEDSSYFYAEIITATHKHRFLYKHNEEDQSLVVPLQFAREVLASVLKDPKLAHWKSCVVDKEEERKMASEFRDLFTSLE